jgi:succinoglycan biosynthesis protein ExoW
MARTNVVIPFYQRERGILPVAVNSALSQGVEDLLVTVVDDGSPVSARQELSEIIARDHRLMVIEQPNAGPGAARNRALDATPDDVAHIAFLDSDDRWLPGHLTNGLTALNFGADFYFSDHSGYESTWSQFAACGAYAPTGTPIPAGDELFFYTGDLFEAAVHYLPVSTPTVIFRRSVAPHLRFPAGLTAGEDTYFWIALMRASRRVAYSTRREVSLGFGVNIYASKAWGSYDSLESILHTSKAWRLIGRDFASSERERQMVAAKLASLRRDFAANILHLLRRREKIDLATCVAYLAAEPALIRDFNAVLAKGLWRKVQG